MKVKNLRKNCFEISDYDIDACKIPRLPSERNIFILPCEIKRLFHCVMSQYHRRHIWKYHWVVENEKQVPFWNDLL